MSLKGAGLIMPPFERAYGLPDGAAASGYSLSANRQSVIVSLLSAGSFAGKSTLLALNPSPNPEDSKALCSVYRSQTI